MTQRRLRVLLHGLNKRNPDKEMLWSILSRALAVHHPNVMETHLLKSSFNIAFTHHLKTPARESGEAYVLHPLRVALRTIEEQKIDGVRDLQSVMLLLLHDNIEEARREGLIQPYRVQFDVGTQLPFTILFELREFTKWKEAGESSEAYCARLAKTLYWRTLYGKFNDRIDNIWTIDAMSPEQRANKIKETERWFPVFRDRLSFLIQLEVFVGKLSPEWLQVPDAQLRRLHAVVERKKQRFHIV